MEKREINRHAARLSSLLAVLAMAGCASTQSVPPSDTLAAQAPSPTRPSAAAQPAAAPAAPAPAPILVAHDYVVKRGDTLTGIAKANNCSIDDLRLWNKLGARSRLRIGQTLRIVTQDTRQAPAAQPTAPATPAAASDAAAAVQPGESTASDRKVVQQTKRHASGVALAWPAHGKIVDGFRPGQNRGIQIAGRAGDPVRAAADGRVMYAGTGLNDYGSLIIVQHNADFLTAYAHNRKLLVKTGDVVHQGDEIAEMGDLDNSRVALLFEVRRDGKPVNPLPYLPSSRG
ncbi:peptidoglycan DD-metalloendopeptidase family protein [Burkholderia pseudomultivorans]|uniref:Murein hydrolase activator NlpD n=1 Tax=Burkholderia pseudomultivorans TaxID=1207504 RepID=A0ABU2DX07_9BURK|nr:peptidoglycan DD-metalloendopeptidase family protein [Burkholderia pseudomultivorans]MDR8729334.1 Murein hydrolase activator NlpD [Burkholderia pseudomultivorans]MDR8733698.1 Murein hydrolase activator NlpD [Burkholderia pseudomultivorans]MDR8740224.1 Murein hydrolase activator NlpD [Burkholderia pseudomultivorans]MDR8752107.1 Murein hydrolase activator NlpD [Burkholderia pseudomultivorans]MDR8776501.1 Murein hydrolase activator NlpD [Burkholderia pseudomultivorans]